MGQIGQTVLSFLRTIASVNGGTTVYLSISGFTELQANFDQPTPFPVISAVVNMAVVNDVTQALARLLEVDYPTPIPS